MSAERKTKSKLTNVKGSYTKNTKKNETKPSEKGGKEMQSIEQNESSNESSTQDVIRLSIAPHGMHGMRELKTLSEGNSLPPVSDIDRSTDLRAHLEHLRAAQSGSMNLLDDTTVHLHGLMHTVSEEPRQDVMVKNTVSLARELHKTMRLKLDSVKALHKISKDIEESEHNKQQLRIEAKKFKGE